MESHATPAHHHQLRISPQVWVPLAGAAVFSVAITVVLVVYREALQGLGDWSYAGAFLIMLINNATIILPAFGQAFIIAVAETLNPFLLALVGGAGAAIGELTGYILGASGRRVMNRTTFIQRLPAFPPRLMGPLLLLFAATPLPFDIAGLSAGSLHYPLWRFLAWVSVGKIISTLALAYLGILSVDWVDGWFR